jgi:uncharacterized protein (TIGR00251 family)
MILSIKVVPNSKKLEIIKLSEENYKIKLDEKSAGGRANIRLIEVLSEYFKVKKSSIKIMKGRKSRDKIVEIS